jgi:ribosome-associated translation inhibitor RaiA
MDIEIAQRDVNATGDMQAFVERRLTAALDRFDPHIVRVTVWLRDVNGPKGGDSHNACKVEVKLRGDEVFVEERGPTPEAAVSAAADALREVVRRAIGRRKHGIGGQRGVQTATESELP